VGEGQWPRTGCCRCHSPLSSCSFPQGFPPTAPLPWCSLATHLLLPTCPLGSERHGDPSGPAGVKSAERLWASPSSHPSSCEKGRRGGAERVGKGAGRGEGPKEGAHPFAVALPLARARLSLPPLSCPYSPPPLPQSLCPDTPSALTGLRPHRPSGLQGLGSGRPPPQKDLGSGAPCVPFPCSTPVSATLQGCDPYTRSPPRASDPPVEHTPILPPRSWETTPSSALWALSEAQGLGSVSRYQCQR